MDFTQYNTRVIQEPRGMIRVITLIFAILAFATTSGFDTVTSFDQTCRNNITLKGVSINKINFEVEYPFKFEGRTILTANNCEDREKESKAFPMDFSSSAQFYVATGVLSFLYSTACLVLYIFGSHYYEGNPLIPVIDMAATGVLTIFWLAGACAWAAGVSDVKYYTRYEYLSSHLPFCTKSMESVESVELCHELSPGKWTSLNISLIFGFANVFLWAASMWFVFKETQFHHKQPMPDQLGAQPGLNQFGDQMGNQQQMPAQTHFPQQRQFADGY